MTNVTDAVSINPLSFGASGRVKDYLERVSNFSIFLGAIALCLLVAGIASLVVPTRYQGTTIMRIGHVPGASLDAQGGNSVNLIPIEDASVVRERLVENVRKDDVYVSDVKIINKSSGGVLVGIIVEGGTPSLVSGYLDQKVKQLTDAHAKLMNNWKDRLNEELSAIGTRLTALEKESGKLVTGSNTLATALFSGQISGTIQALWERKYRIQRVLSGPSVSNTEALRNSVDLIKLRPNPVLYFIIAVFLGVFLGISLVGLRNLLLS